ncbi:MAG TPA: glycosyltransferase family 4 protein [Candidatus Bathyarchaeia archaeon]|nr:glycosyltransferase family 4 protein [Candidatus Bathyarchaeia archaeon]
MNVAVAYDCLYPFTIGGAEKWYRGVAERLAARHRVSYLTRRQWSGEAAPALGPNLDVVTVCGPAPLYGESGRRRIAPTLAYGAGLLRHLVRNRRRYDVIHVASFPFFSVLAARAAEAIGGPPCVVDWLEVWSREGWEGYLGGSRGRVGGAIQQLCIRLSRTALVHSELHRRRLEEAGCPTPPHLLRGLYGGPVEGTCRPGERAPLVVFAGRLIADKGVASIPAAIAIARRRVPALEAVIFGDGPARAQVEQEIDRLGLHGAVRCAGFVAEPELREALGRAMCLALPSAREGYGLVVVEAAAFGTPSVVLRARESAAGELIAHGENGLVIDGGTPEELAAALLELHARGAEISRSTRAWFARCARDLSIDTSIATLESIYSAAAQRDAWSRP